MAKSIITKVVGIPLVLFGVLFLITGIIQDGYWELSFFVVCVVLAAFLMGTGILLIRWGGRKPAAQGPHGYVPQGPGASIMPNAPLPQGPGTTYQPSPVNPPSPATASLEDPLYNMVVRSSDPYSSLKDLVRHDQAGGRDSAASHATASLLAAGGILDWTNAPQVGMVRLSRTNRYWTSMPGDLPTESYDMAMGVEAALNVGQELPPAGITTAAAQEKVMAAASAHLLSSLDGPLPAWDPTPDLSLAYPGMAPQDTPGEWLERMGVSFYAEHYPADVRISYDIACDVSQGVSCLRVDLPSPQALAPFAECRLDQVRLARTYGLRLCLLMARMAFDACARVGRVVVNGTPHDDDTVLLCLDLDRAALARLAPVTASDAVTQGGFPQDPTVLAAFDEEGWFLPQEATLRLDDEPVSPLGRLHAPELDHRPCPPAMARACGAGVMADLGINESAGRTEAFSRLAPALGGGTTEGVVAALVALRDEPGWDLSVAEACERTSNELVSGSLDVLDEDGIRSVFVNGSTLDRAVTRALELTDVPDEEPPRLDEALSLLEGALAPIEQVGLYLDDSSTVYRYFGSVAERVKFNRELDDHTREVRLVPDSYLRAHLLCARVLNTMERYDEALEHGRVAQRIAPMSIDADLAVVRSLEDQSRTYEAADQLLASLAKSATARDASICHYRLAYMQWKLGRTDLAVACYQRALRWNTDICPQASSELDDLLENNPQLRRLSDDEAAEALRGAGIPLGGSRELAETTLAAAMTCVDSGLFSTARPLLGIGFEMIRDDTLVNVYRSLIPAQ